MRRLGSIWIALLVLAHVALQPYHVHAHHSEPDHSHEPHRHPGQEPGLEGVAAVKVAGPILRCDDDCRADWHVHGDTPRFVLPKKCWERDSARGEAQAPPPGVELAPSTDHPPAPRRVESIPAVHPPIGVETAPSAPRAPPTL